MFVWDRSNSGGALAQEAFESTNSGDRPKNGFIVLCDRRFLDEIVFSINFTIS